MIPLVTKGIIGGVCIIMNSLKEKISIIEKYNSDKEQILSILFELQGKSKRNYIDKETADLVAEKVGLPKSRVYEIITYYAMLKAKPNAKYVLKICNSTPCHFSKSEEIVKILEEELMIRMNETTEDGLFSYHYIPCCGACDIGPVIKVKDTVYGNLNREKIRELLKDFREGKRDQ